MFRERLDNLLGRQHELLKLAGLIDWDIFEKEFGQFYSEKQGHPGIPIRLMVAFCYLGNAYGLSAEAVVAKWVLKPYCQ